MMGISVRTTAWRVAAVAVMVAGLAACGNGPQPTDRPTSGKTAAPTRTAISRADACAGAPPPRPSYDNPVDVISTSWLVGFGPGTTPEQIAAEKAFVANYNKTNYDYMYIQLQIVPNATALDVLKTEIAAGNAPDIIGPFGREVQDQLQGMLYDLNDDIDAGCFDTTVYEPAVLKSTQDHGAQTALPYQVYPGYMFYNKDLFNKAGLPPLPTKVGDTYRGKAWDWQQAAEVASLLTLDKNGKNAAQAGFRYQDTTQYGFGLESADARRLGSLFGAGSLDAGDGFARVPASWTAAYSWYHDAMWKSHFAVTAQATVLSCLGCSGTTALSSGRVAMAPSWPWAVPSYSKNGTTGFAWDMGVLPSLDGRTTAPMDVDSFAITRASLFQSQTIKTLRAIMADPKLMAAYGGMPAAKPMQPAWVQAQALAASRARVGTAPNWDVLAEMSKYPAIPSHAQYLPNQKQSQSDLAAFLLNLQSKSDLSVQAEVDKLQTKLSTDFKAVQPLLTP